VKLVADNNVVGLPVICPLLLLNCKPSDAKLTVPVIAYVLFPYPLVPAVTGVIEYDDEFLVKLNGVVCDNVVVRAGRSTTVILIEVLLLDAEGVLESVTVISYGVDSVTVVPVPDIVPVLLYTNPLGNNIAE
jgi:hypothetical protein